MAFGHQEALSILDDHRNLSQGKVSIWLLNTISDKYYPIHCSFQSPKYDSHWASFQFPRLITGNKRYHFSLSCYQNYLINLALNMNWHLLPTNRLNTIKVIFLTTIDRNTCPFILTQYLSPYVFTRYLVTHFSRPVSGRGVCTLPPLYW